jgi:uncharacterized paraquat-inducible protein A
MSKAKCPNCGESFGRLKGGKCPFCEAELIRTRKKEGKLNISRYELARSIAVETKEPEEEENLFFQSPGVKIYKTGDKKYTAYFNVYVERVVCPECRLMAFKPKLMEGEVEHKCNRCKAITMFIFDVYNRSTPKFAC